MDFYQIIVCFFQHSGLYKISRQQYNNNLTGIVNRHARLNHVSLTRFGKKWT